MAASLPAPSPPAVEGAHDLIATGDGDTAGYHMYVAAASGQWRWQPIVTVDPAGYMDDTWIGQQCTTADGKYVVVVVAPRTALNNPTVSDRGGMAYAIDINQRSARPIVGGVALLYYSPSCGLGDTAVLTRYLGSDEATTQLLRVDAATATVTQTVTAVGEYSSGVPVGEGIVAVRGGEVTKFTGDNTTSILAELPGQAYDVHPNSVGGVDALVSNDGKTATLWRVDGTSSRSVGAGAVLATRTFLGRDGRSIALGLTPSDASADITLLPSPTGELPWDVSLDSTMFLTGYEKATHRSDISALRESDTGAMLPPTPLPVGGDVTTAIPSSVQPLSSGDSTDSASGPVCAEPRNSTVRQVLQPDNHQVDWAIQEGVRNLLVGTNGRPANAWNMTYPAYTPNGDFPTPALHGQPSGTAIPPQAVEATFANESNWDQASPHALRGMAGNPLIADYYGDGGVPDHIDYGKADCGYGVGQVTDFMTLASKAVTPDKKSKVAVDYAENTAASISILASKWNQLYDDGITLNGGNALEAENWYFAFWAYNSGINGKPGKAPFGLSWTNNPANAKFLYGRQEFIYNGNYDDAKHPSSWAYQERTMGWMDDPLLDSNGHYLYQPITSPGDYLSLPSASAFCDASIHCTPCDNSHCGAGVQGWYCGAASCWWHSPVTFASCPASCHTGFFNVPTSATEPAQNDPLPPQCSPGANLPSSAIIVDDESTGGTPMHTYNLVGCPQKPSGWTSQGRFSIAFGSDVGEIDWHQLGAGFAGHMYFAHPELTTETRFINTVTWTPASTKDDPGYLACEAGNSCEIRVFIPDIGAGSPTNPFAVVNATYIVNRGASRGTTSVTINQNKYANEWVSLGNFDLGDGASVRLSNATTDPTYTCDHNCYDIGFDAMAFIPQPIAYGGGDVAAGVSYSYIIFWQPPGHGTPSSDYDAKLFQYMTDAGYTPEFKHVLTQYYETNPKKYVGRVIPKDGWLDTHAYPSHASCGANCLDAGAVADEVQYAIKQNPKWTYRTGNVYYVFTGTGEDICSNPVPGQAASCSTNTGVAHGGDTICGYHFGDVAGYVWAAIAYPDDATGCQRDGGDNGAVDDGGIWATAHELSEAITDPLGQGWCGNQGRFASLCTAYEVGDMCQDSTHMETVAEDGNRYMLQDLWSIKKNRCDH